MYNRALVVLAMMAWSLGAADKYKGPRPPKPDVPYLVHADNLVPTEAAEAHEESKKGDTTYVINGVSSPARTPLSEPIFLIDTQELSAERLELYRLDVRNGRREVTLSQKRKRGGPKPLHLLVTRLGDHLYRVEADEHLDNGEYALSPNGSQQVFCFQVY